MSSRIRRLAIVAAVAVAAVAGAIIASSSSPSAATPAPPKPSSSSLFAGIPEHQGVLGESGAPITVTEFLDPQCPVCAAASKEILPQLVNTYIKTGKVKLDAEVLQFLGPDSVTAARWADGARMQNKLWPFLEMFYASQGTENSGYVTDAFLRQVADASGVDATTAAAHADTPAAADALNQANAAAQQLGVNGTPTFVVTKADGSRQVVSASDLLAVLAR